MASILNPEDFTPEFMTELRKTMTKPIVKFTDMPNENASEALDLITSSVDKFVGNHESASRLIKETMDKKFGEAWNCVIGEGFDFDVSYQTKNMLYVYYQNVAVLLFKY